MKSFLLKAKDIMLTKSTEILLMAAPIVMAKITSVIFLGEPQMPESLSKKID